MKQQNQHDSSAHWLKSCEQSFRLRLDQIAEEIDKLERLKIIRLTGPTCSGKTTVANLLIRRLGEKGKNVHLVSIDDFFFDKEVLHRRAEQRGDQTIDYESEDTLDLEELSRFVSDFSKKDRCDCPCFDFRLGKRTGYRRIDCQEHDIFIFEGIQVLYPKVSALLERYPSIGIYIEPQSDIEVEGIQFDPHEIRLLRRIVRDYNFRGTDAERTFEMWEGVRHNEEKNIFPYVGHCTLQIDSTMPYEIGVLTPYLQKILKNVPVHSPFRCDADRILNKIKTISPISDEWIPSDSLYKEFV